MQNECSECFISDAQLQPPDSQAKVSVSILVIFDKFFFV